MAACTGCGTQLPGRRQKCDTCKGATGRPTRKAPAKPRPGSRAPRKKPAAKKVAAPAKKAAAKKTPAAKRPTAPSGLGPRGRELWKSLGKELGTPAGTLAVEACRLADRLEDLDRIIAGKGVLQLMSFRLDHAFTVADVREIRVKVEFSNVLGEARQQQGALLKLLDGLGVAKSGTAPAPPAGGEKPAAAKSPLDEVGARRQQREQEA